MIVRVWTSRANPNERRENVMHVSIQTPVNYMSLWPKQPAGFGEQSAKEQEGRGVRKGISRELVPNYDIDYEYEKREPEIVICFYTLDVKKLDAKFYEFRRRLKGWNVFGICRDCESCASFAWKLLEAAEIRKLVSHVKESCVVSKGEAVGSGAVKLTKNPETRDIGYLGETRIIPGASKGCLVM